MLPRIQSRMEDAVWDAIVLGAGMAGLAAARTLAEAGQRVLILEASGRIGGRILTEHVGTEVVELGAEFIHGRPPELLALLEEAGLATYERVGEFLELQEDGALAAPGEDRSSALEALEGYEGPDCSFVEYLDRTDPPLAQRFAEIGYVEGFNAADANEASVLALGLQQRAEAAIEGDRAWRVTAGYDRVPAFLLERAKAAGAQVLLESRAYTVEWMPGGATVLTDDGRSFTAARVLMTLPFGLMQARALRFVPAVPAWFAAADAMRMGQVCRFTLVFNKRVWPEAMSFLLTPDLLPTVWWTAYPSASLTLTGWVGGPRAAELLGRSWVHLMVETLASVAEVFQLTPEVVRDAFVSFHTHDWHEDGGAYSWVPVGGLEASAAMAQPIADTLYFAGEHTDLTGHWGTVHAAYGSGLRAARQMLTS